MNKLKLLSKGKVIKEPPLNVFISNLLGHSIKKKKSVLKNKFKGTVNKDGR